MTLKIWVKIASAISVLLVIIVLVSNKEIIQLFMLKDFEEIGVNVEEQFLPLFAITLIIMMIQNFITFIPLILILTVNIAFYGFVYGLMWSWFASVAAATLVFVCARYSFKEILQKKISEKMKRKAEENGFMYVFMARVFPFVPTNIVNIVSGISSIRFKDFLLATSIGNFIYFFILALVPMGILSLNFELIILSIFIFIVVIYIYLRRKQRVAFKKSN